MRLSIFSISLFIFVISIGSIKQVREELLMLKTVPLILFLNSILKGRQVLPSLFAIIGS